MRTDYWLKPEAEDLILHVGPAHEHKTLESARDAMRTLPPGDRRRTMRVVVHDGTYFLSDTFTLGPADSGTPDAPVIYQAAPGSAPRISGGVLIAGWKQTKIKGKEAWRVTLPYVKAGWYFTQLYVAGQRRPRTRLPREGFHFFRQVSAEAKADRAGFFAGDIKPWRNLSDVEVIVPHYWVESHLPIRRVDAKKREVHFARESVMTLNDEKKAGTSRYWIENVAEALDTPGQWYLERRSGTLTYLPLPGEKIENTEVVAPRLSELVRMEGEPAPDYHADTTDFTFKPAVAPSRPESAARVERMSHRTVHDIHLVGFAFCHTGWNYPETPAGSVQAAWEVPGAIHARHAADCSIRLCSVSQTENYAIELAAGARRIEIVGNRLDDLGGGGIKLGHDSHFNVVSDNSITRGGRRYPSAVGVWIGHSGDNIVSRNLIHDFFYTGISVGWVWGYTPSAARRNIIAKNHIHRIGQGVLSDMGGIYSLGVSPGTRITGNLIHDIHYYGYGASGLYPDEGSSFIAYTDNIVFDTDSGSVHMNYGRDCLFQNNLLVDSRDCQVAWGTPKFLCPFKFEGNVVVFGRGGLFKGVCLDGIPQIEFDRNTYWHVSGRPIDFAGVSWEDWRRRGFDPNSRIADPLLVKSNDTVITLRGDSPATASGFRPPPNDAGPRAAVLATGLTDAACPNVGPLVWSRIECEGADAIQKGERAYFAYPDRSPCAFTMVAVMENAGDATFEGRIEFLAFPADKIEGAAIDARIEPGQSVTLKLPLAVAAGTDEIVVKTASNSPGFWGTSLGLAFRPVAVALRLPENIRIEKVKATLKKAPPSVVTLGQRTVGTFRVGVAGDRLALSVEVVETGIELRDPVYFGSMIDLFGMTLDAPGEFGQAFLVPAGGGKKARLLESTMRPGKNCDFRFEPCPGGYRMQALLPLAMLKIRIQNGEFAFMGAIYTHLPGLDRIVPRHLFNQRSRGDIHAYGIFKIQECGIGHASRMRRTG